MIARFDMLQKTGAILAKDSSMEGRLSLMTKIQDLTLYVESGRGMTCRRDFRAGI